MSTEPLDHSKALSARRLATAGIVGAVAIVLIVAVGLTIRSREARRLNAWTDAQAVPSVKVVMPLQITNGATLQLPGRLDALNRASIFARVNGYLKAWYVDIGASVKAGQLLAEIDTPELDQQLLQARADLRTAQANAALAAITAKRWQALAGTDSVAQQDVDQRTSDYAAKEAAVTAAQANVRRLIAMKGFARITAPFDGVVTSRDTDVGALINAGTGGVGEELFTVSDVKQLRVYVQVPQNYVGDIKPDESVKLSVPAYPTEAFTAHVVASAGAVNPGSGTTLVQLLVDNSSRRLLPGGFASVAFPMPVSPGMLSIPASALVFDNRGLTIATVGNNDRVTYRKVTIRRDFGNTVEIGSGISPGERVIDTPPDGLVDGDVVQVVGTQQKG